MKHRILTVTVKPGDNSKHPLIFLGGKWLRECGFDIGCKVLVECKRGALNIRAIRFEEDGDNTPLTLPSKKRGRGCVIEEREVMQVAEHS